MEGLCFKARQGEEGKSGLGANTWSCSLNVLLLEVITALITAERECRFTQHVIIACEAGSSWCQVLHLKSLLNLPLGQSDRDRVQMVRCRGWKLTTANPYGLEGPTAAEWSSRLPV